MKYRSHSRIILYCFHTLSLADRHFGLFLLARSETGHGKPYQADNSASRQNFTAAGARSRGAGSWGARADGNGGRELPLSALCLLTPDSRSYLSSPYYSSPLLPATCCRLLRRLPSTVYRLPTPPSTRLTHDRFAPVGGPNNQPSAPLV